MITGAHRRFLPFVAAFVFDRAHADYLHRTFDGHAVLSVCDNDRDLLAQLECKPVDMLVASVAYPDGHSTVPFLSVLRTRMPHLPVIAYAELTAPGMLHVLAAGHAGIGSLLVHGTPLSPREGDALLRDAQVHTLLGSLESTLVQARSEYVRRFVQYCLTHAADPMTVDSVAATIGVSRQHIAREFASSGLRKPSWFLHASRVLLAAKLLDTPRQSVEHVARVLHFRTGTALRQTLRQYTGMTATELRVAGGLHHVLALVRDAIAPYEATSVATFDFHPFADVPFVNPNVPFTNGGRGVAAV